VSFLESIVYGFISGLTELIPVSPQGHQALMLRLFGVSVREPVRDMFVHIAILIDGKKIKNNDIYRANNAAIIADSDFDQREIIVKLIETKLITKEAERLNLNVNSYDIKNNIDALKEGYKNQESGTEFIKNIMQQLDMSEDEYWLYEEEVQYNIYMKLELQKYLALNDKDYEEYVEHLTDIADIKFVDAQLESIYYNHK